MSKLSTTNVASLLSVWLILTLHGFSGMAQVKTQDQISAEESGGGGNSNSWRNLSNNKLLTFQQVQANFNEYWKGRKSKKGEGFKVFKRWENFMAPRVYPSGDLTLPSTTYEKFMAWERDNSTKLSGSRITAANAVSSTANWTEIAPVGKPKGYDSGVGRIDFVRFDPTNSNTMYVCSPDGGLWKTIDGGANWTTNTDFLPIIGCADLVIDPTNTQIMYLATGNRENDRSSIGILKSTNGGTTWSPTSLIFPPENLLTIRRLVMNPTNPNIMVAVTNDGIYSTTDGWVNFTFAALGSFDDAEYKPGNPTSSTVYISGKKFYRSTNNGSTWNEISTGLPDGNNVSRALIAVTAANPDYVYALYGNNDGGYLGTYRSTDGGTSFTERSSLASLGNNIINCDTATTVTSGQASHNLALVISPTDAEMVSIGGCNVWQSADGGITWQLSSYWLGNDNNYPGEGAASPDYVHADIQSLDYLPGSSSVLFVTSDGGISKSTNGGNKKWTDISNNLLVAQMTNVGQSALTPYNMITGLQDIGTLKNSNGNWFVTNGGDGEDGFIDRTNDMNIITSNPNGAFALSNDAGVNRDDITGIPAGIEFFSPIAQDPVTANLVYAGGRPAFYKSTSVLSDPNAPWTVLGTPDGTGGITRFAIAPSNNQVIYVLKGNDVSKSTDGGATFTNINGTLPLNEALPTNVCVSNTDDKKVWVTFSGFSAANKVFRSVDGGTSWTNISTGLPNIPMNTIVFDNSSTNDAVYVGADIGVYYMDNSMPWAPFFTALPRNHVNDLEIYYPTSKIRAATYGRGLWESDLFVPAALLPTVSLSVSANAGSEANQTSILVTVTASAAVTGNQTITLSVDGTNITAGDFTLTAAPVAIAGIDADNRATLPITAGGNTKKAVVATNVLGGTNQPGIAANDKSPRTSIHQTESFNATTHQGLSANAVAGVTITIPNGQTTGTATFKIVDDAIVEATETAVLTINTPSSGITLGTPITQNITITDNDIACVKPTAGTLTATKATCNAAGTAANSDAAISVPGIINGTSYAFTTDGSTPMFAGATTITGGTINLTGIANPAAAVTYKFRIFNGAADCFEDFTIVLQPTSCTDPCNLLIAPVLIKND